MKQRVLILCTGNSCRSQMAEALWRKLGGDRWECFSAGSNPAGYVHPLAIEAMREIDVDLSDARSKHLDEYVNEPIDLAITVCDHARESCPVMPGVSELLHWPFDDPATATGTEEEQRTVFRQVRDQIAERIREFLSPYGLL